MIKKQDPFLMFVNTTFITINALWKNQTF